MAEVRRTREFVTQVAVFFLTGYYNDGCRQLPNWTRNCSSASWGKSPYWDRTKHENQVSRLLEPWNTAQQTFQQCSWRAWVCCRNCIIDKNVKIGKDVVIMNKEVSASNPVRQTDCIQSQNLQAFLICIFVNFRAWKKQIDPNTDSMFGRESPL